MGGAPAEGVLREATRKHAAGAQTAETSAFGRTAFWRRENGKTKEYTMAIMFIPEDEPFELRLQQLPSARSEDGTVVLTLPVYAFDFPANTVEIRVPMSIQQADDLWGQLQPALTMARIQARRP
jgi:hypothetical protein